MEKQFDKIKLSQHQQENLDEGRPGHNVTRDEAEQIIENPLHTEIQSSARTRFWGITHKNIHRVVVSAGVSAALSGELFIGRVVTAHRDRSPKK